MKKYKIYHPIYMSFYSKSLYKDIGENWKGSALPYLLLLLAIISLFLVLDLRFVLNSTDVNKYLKQVVSQVPPIKITKGKVIVDRNMPYVIVDPSKAFNFLVIDTSGQTTSIDKHSLILLTSDKLFIKNGKVETRIIDLSNVKSFYLDQSQINRWIQITQDWLWILIYPFILLFVFILRIVQILVNSVIAVIFAKAFKTEINYLTLFRLSTVAFTPVIILIAIQWLTNFKIPYWNWICFFIAMGYLVFAVKSNSEKEFNINL